MPNNWAEWDAEHGHGGGSTSSAQRIADQIRGSLGHTTPAAPKTSSERARGSGSVVSRAADSRSTVVRVQKKNLKAKAPVKGEKYAGDSMKTKIRMAEYNRQKKAAVAADPVDRLTPRTEVKANPHRPVGLTQKATEASTAAVKNPSASTHRAAAEAHTNAASAAAAMGKNVAAKGHVAMAKMHLAKADTLATKETAASSASRMATAIKSVFHEHSVTSQRAVRHAPGSAEDLADKADAASRQAGSSRLASDHRLAAAAHREAVDKSGGHGDPARRYHELMIRHHNRMSGDSLSSTPVNPGVKEEHKDAMASQLPNNEHYLLSGHMDTESRRRSDRSYDSVAKASESGLTATQKASVSHYTGSGYSSINNHLRGINSFSSNSPAAIDTHVKRLDAAFAKQTPLTKDMVTYRGVSEPDDLFGPVGSRVGAEFVDKGYGSTASHASVANSFGQGALIRILHPKGSRVLKPSDVGVFGDREREILTPRGSRYHVAADRMVTMHDGTQKRMIDLVRK